jgi:glycosyltransferase involved in cell wall biosynthesis
VHDLKISLITVVRNAENTITSCIDSVIRQNFNNVEYIIIDGGSTDGTVQVIEKYRHYLSHFVSEPDQGIYDAMNKGIKLAKGHIVGMLNADDFFADETVLSSIAAAFEKSNMDILYADLDYIDYKGRVVRKWRSGAFKRRNLNFGWMPPHPTFYCKRNLFEEFGLYSLDYGTAADYELMLRMLFVHKVPTFYLKKVLIKMKTGGKSNVTLIHRLNGLKNDFKAMRTNRILLPVLTIFIKPLRKFTQYF